ncbi:MAG: cytochrome c biogenesis CcdA family protein [Acidimicrobiales bacterium]|nr:cytochrome c biogenesis CcdA family protein [Acidimicrobiales bacterium]
MISAPVALAFTAGMVASFNPCGFSLLPAYIGAFVAGDSTERRTDQRILRAVGVAAAVSIGFVVVFAVAGIVIDSIAGEARRQLPWVTIVIGALLVVGGVAALAGWKPTLATRGPNLVSGRRGVVAMVGYGITYAIASLSCTLGPFLAVTGAALAGSTTQGVLTYVAYALGMGTIILAISVAAALARTTMTTSLRQFSRYAPRIGGALMIIAGGYAIWYGRWELRVYQGDLEGDPVIDAIENLRLSVVDTIQQIGAGRLAAVVLTVTVVIVASARGLGRDRADEVETPGEAAKTPVSPEI